MNLRDAPVNKHTWSELCFFLDNTGCSRTYHGVVKWWLQGGKFASILPLWILIYQRRKAEGQAVTADWIFVKDEMPPDHTEVIVYAENEQPSVFTAQHWAKQWHRSSSGEYAPLDDFFGDNEISVTRWMPLPKP